MRFGQVLLGLSVALSSGLASPVANGKTLAVRQDHSTSSSAFQTLSSDSPSSTAASESQDVSESLTASAEPSAPESTSASNVEETAAVTESVTPSSTVPDSITTNTARPTSTVSGNATTNGTTTGQEDNEALPLPPRITPALSVGGVFLILSGIACALIGIKNKWVHVFLSTAFLASITVLVLIIYVMHRPISNAIQGAYFVGIFMSGVVFGGGALIFKEVTEGLGCLLGGFCLSMWFLTLKSGGLVTSSGGKGILIGVLCVVCWSLSFSHYTRAYGLMFSTSFSGATAFVLGIDCFSRGGLKEFWVYLWNLNDDLFPLNTTTYPVTRGTRVETVIVILGTIIGIISQIKLWKVVQTRQKAREAVQAEEERRRDAEEETMSRHIARQNDRDRVEWEKRYGDHLDPKRTVITSIEVPDENKRISSTTTTEVDSMDTSESNKSVEVTPMPYSIMTTPLRSSKSQRQSNIVVQPIHEMEEEKQKWVDEKAHQERSRTEAKLDGLSPQLLSGPVSCDSSTASLEPCKNELTSISSIESIRNARVAQSLKPSNTKPSSENTADRLRLLEGDSHGKNRTSIQSLTDLKRKSIQSLKSSMNSERSPRSDHFGQSQEALVNTVSTAPHSRASSVAATFDNENEKVEMPVLDTYDLQRDSRPPQILISPVNGMSFEESLKAGVQGPSSPSGLSDHFEADPEELRRPAAEKIHGIAGFDFDLDMKRSTGGVGDTLMEGGFNTRGDASQAFSGEVLTEGALEKVPSQTSNVVLSYRTNEWAKHIAGAEAPVYEEAEAITVQDQELLTHLAPVASMPEETIESGSVKKSPSLLSPAASVAPSEAGVKINPDIQHMSMNARTMPEVVGSKPAPASPTKVSSTASRTLSAVSAINRRSFTDSIQTQSSFMPAKSSRRTSNPMQRQPSVLQSTPIHENVATDFTSRRNAPKRASTNSQQQYTHPGSQTNLVRSSSYSQQQYPSAFRRSDSFNGSNLDLLNRTVTASSIPPYYQNDAQAMGSETRLRDSAGTRSHQPLQRNHTNDSSRTDMMTNWRMQLAQGQNPSAVYSPTAENKYNQQMTEYEMEKLRKQHEQRSRAKKEAVVDQTMRTQGMLDAHKEVLKRMQSQANQKMRDVQKQPNNGK